MENNWENLINENGTEGQQMLCGQPRSRWCPEVGEVFLDCKKMGLNE